MNEFIPAPRREDLTSAIADGDVRGWCEVPSPIDGPHYRYCKPSEALAEWEADATQTDDPCPSLQW